MILRTLKISILGVLIFMFTILVDDEVLEYQSYVRSFLVLFGLHFGLTSLSRLSILNIVKAKIRKGSISFPTLLIGDKRMFLNSIDSKSVGFRVVKSITDLKSLIANDGAQISELIENELVTNVVILEGGEPKVLKELINELSFFKNKVEVQIAPQLYSIISSWMSVQSDPNAALLSLRYHHMPRWEQVVKRILDIVISDFLLLFLFPLIIFIIIKVRLSSEGPILFRQDRIGKNGRPFKIIKFRSMTVNAEESGPLLSYEGDERCTPWGAFMRKWRLDEIPQFINVLKGEMSLVGPRPERQFFIDQIKNLEPNYRKLTSVKPGITSLGQVKYGYASDVAQMVQRLKFDLIYLDNRSLALDFKILFYTFLVLLKGTGK